MSNEPYAINLYKSKSISINENHGAVGYNNKNKSPDVYLFTVVLVIID